MRSHAAHHAVLCCAVLCCVARRYTRHREALLASLLLAHALLLRWSGAAQAAPPPPGAAQALPWLLRASGAEAVAVFSLGFKARMQPALCHCSMAGDRSACACAPHNISQQQLLCSCPDRLPSSLPCLPSSPPCPQLRFCLFLPVQALCLSVLLAPLAAACPAALGAQGELAALRGAARRSAAQPGSLLWSPHPPVFPAACPCPYGDGGVPPGPLQSCCAG